MKILAITNELTFSGAPIILYRFLASICQEHQVTVTSILGPGPLTLPYVELGIPIVSGCKISDFDLVLCNTLVSAGIIKHVHQDVPTVLWIHEPQFGLKLIQQKSIDVDAFKLATQIVFPTRWQAQTLYAPWLGDRQWLYVPYGVCLPEAVPSCPFSNKERGLNLMHIGTIESRKGQDVTIEAIRQLNEPDIRVFFVGTLRDKSVLNITPSETERLVTVGPVPPESSIAYLYHSDALILPTRDDNTPMAVLEAMWLGRCVISSDFGPLSELIEHGKTGLLFPTGDSKALAANIALIKRNPELRATLGQNAAISVRQSHSFDQHRSDMLRALQSAATAWKPA
ncbi:MAG TPA: glycosyltransferase family 4 protein [Phycisphaerae bacterium]|nr:glycosyltransferase family 4 protein [Phycisphaerae bacterium]